MINHIYLIIVLLFGIVFVSLLCFLAAGFRGLNHGPQLFWVHFRGPPVIFLGLSPLPVTAANEALVRDPLLKT